LLQLSVRTTVLTVQMLADALLVSLLLHVVASDACAQTLPDPVGQTLGDLA